MQLHTTVRVLTWPACDGRGAGTCTAPDTTTARQLLHHHVLESHAAVLPHSTSAHQHITLALLPSCAIIPGTMRSGTAHVHVLSALYSITWKVRGDSIAIAAPRPRSCRRTRLLLPSCFVLPPGDHRLSPFLREVGVDAVLRCFPVEAFDLGRRSCVVTARGGS